MGAIGLEPTNSRREAAFLRLNPKDEPILTHPDDANSKKERYPGVGIQQKDKHRLLLLWHSNKRDLFF